MSGPKLTPWFPGTVKPVRVGWYEYFYGLNGLDNEYARFYITRCFWGGKCWLNGPEDDGYWDGWKAQPHEMWRGRTASARNET